LASPSVDTQLIRELGDVLPCEAELVSDVLVSNLWISEHRAQSGECSLAVEAVKPNGTGHVLGCAAQPELLDSILGWVK